MRTFVDKTAALSYKDKKYDFHRGERHKKLAHPAPEVQAFLDAYASSKNATEKVAVMKTKMNEELAREVVDEVGDEPILTPSPRSTNCDHSGGDGSKGYWGE